MNRQRDKLELPAYFWLYLICPCGTRSQEQVGSKIQEVHLHWVWYKRARLYQFWNPKNQKILRHKDVVFNEKVYKDLLTERRTSEKGPGVASQSTLG